MPASHGHCTDARRWEMQTVGALRTFLFQQHMRLADPSDTAAPASTHQVPGAVRVHSKQCRVSLRGDQTVLELTVIMAARLDRGLVMVCELYRKNTVTTESQMSDAKQSKKGAKRAMSRCHPLEIRFS